MQITSNSLRLLQFTGENLEIHTCQTTNYFLFIVLLQDLIIKQLIY